MTRLSAVRVNPSSASQQVESAFVLAGVVRLMVTELELAAADIDSDEVSVYVHDLRRANELLGNALARLRRDVDV